MPQELLGNSCDFTNLTWELFHCGHVQVEIVVIPFELLKDFKMGEFFHSDYKMELSLCQRKS